MNKPADKPAAAVAPKPAPAPPPEPEPTLLERIGRSETGLSFADLQAATGQEDGELQAALDELTAAGRIALGIANGTLCYRCV